MKDNQFLEQLNLYLDGEIDSADAAELEQEILANPARRRIYNDYCRIHRATKLVYQQFRAAGATNEADALPPARAIDSAGYATAAFALGGRTGGRAAPRPFRRLAFASGLAAACAVGIFISTRALTPRPSATAAPAPIVAIAEPPTEAPVVTVAPVAEQPATFFAPFAPTTRPDPFVQFAPTRSDPFALTSWTTADDEAAQPPHSILNPPVLRVDARFRPASLENSGEPRSVREHGPFPWRVNTPKSTATPSDFEVKP